MSLPINKIRWGIIGCGNVCETKSGPAFYKIGHSSLEAVMRRDGELARDFAQRHRVKKWYTDADALINDPEVDIVYVATPPSTHKEYAIRVMQAGKPVYVEKPMAMDAEECREMIRVSEETGQKLFVAYYRRALPYFLKVKDLLETGAIGKPLTVQLVQYRRPGEADKNPATQAWRLDRSLAGEGYFYDLAPHALDILDFLFGEIADAQGFTASMGGLYAVADTVSAAFRFRSGLTGMLQYCFVASEESEREEVLVLGTKGELRFNVFAFKSIRIIREGETLSYDAPAPEHIQQPLIQTIVNELLGGGACPSTGANGWRTARVMDRMVKGNAV